jgi:glycerate 2-kinase
MDIQATPHNRAGELALEIYRKTLSRITGRFQVLESVQLHGDELKVGSETFDLSRYQRIFVCGAGKASPSMTQGLEEILGDRISGGLVATKYGHSVGLGSIREVEAGHPVPDENSLRAGVEMLEFAGRCKPDDLVIFALSGGASALMESLDPEFTLADIRSLNQELLRSNRSIHEINAVRATYSKIKAGGLAGAFGCEVLCLVMSDVEGNSLDVIGSGPLAGTARAIPHLILADHHKMGKIAGEEASALGLAISDLLSMTSDAESFCRDQREKGLLPGVGLSPEHVWDCVVWTGEATLSVRGCGKGGRAQHIGMLMAREIEGVNDVACLVAGSDGTDGPTDAAGALVDGGTWQRAMASGVDCERALSDNDSYHFHEAAGSLIKTGPTGSNLNDICIFVRA